MGVGSTFWFEVELPIATEWQNSRLISQGRHMAGYRGDRKTLLIVDDKWENRSVLVNLLEPLGFVVVEAVDGQDALTQALHIKPDLIITDILMPVMDGYQFLQQVRESAVLQSIPILVSSASVSSIDQQQSLDAGGDDFLSKPIQADELFQMLAKYLHLEWLYDHQSDLQNGESAFTPKPYNGNTELKLQIPPIEDLNQLLKLAQQGRLKKLNEIATQLAQHCPQYDSLVQKLLELSKEFQVEQLEALIQDLINDATCA